MQTQMIRKKIAGAVADENRTGRTAGLLREFSTARGLRPTKANIKDGVAFIREYIEHVPVLIEGTMAAAQRAGMVNTVAPVLQIAEQYFFDPHDVIPDHLGLVGLMDDAYFTISLLQAISDTCQQRTGRPLFSIDLKPASSIIRGLIGEPHASQLDMGVQAVFQIQALQQGLGPLMNYGATLPVQDPIWGGATMDEIVNARLGAMGFVS